MDTLIISIIVFLCMAPVSIISRNIANIIINNKAEIWTTKNNSTMMLKLSEKNSLFFIWMCVEIAITLISFFSFILNRFHLLM